MKNSKLRRVLMLMACAVLLVCLSVGATLAYLTSTTDVVKNTFTVGDVEITLDEAEVDEYGENENGRTDSGNEYKLLPGHVYKKDPTVTVQAKSEDCFVRMIATINDYDKLVEVYGYQVLPQDLVNGTWDNVNWPCHGTMNVSADGKTAVCEFRYKDIVEYSESATKLEPLFTQIKVDGSVVDETNIDKLNTVTIDIVAHAIQADGFNGDAEAAWVAYGTQKAN